MSDSSSPFPSVPSDNSASSDSAPPARPASPPPPAGPRRPTLFGRVLSMVGVLVFGLSILLNIYLALLLGLTAGTEMGFATQVLRQGQKDQTVAVVRIEGMIDSQMADRFEYFVRVVLRKDNIRAVVLEINSPGGTVSASERIYQGVLALKDTGRTVLVSMEAVAASGGYYIAAPADEIFAQPATVTGSIGVIAMIPNIKGTLEKIGMKMHVLKSTHARAWKDQLSMYRDIEPREKAYLVEILDKMQGYFEQAVRNGRGERLETRQEEVTVSLPDGDGSRQETIQITAPFNGKIYLGEAAVDLGLVDRIGYLDDAVNRAAELAKLSRPRAVRYRIRPSLLEQFIGARQSGIQLDLGSIEEAQTPQLLMMWKE